MERKYKRMLFWAGLLLVLILVMVPPSLDTVTLSDGTEVRLAAVTYGKSHVFDERRSVVQWFEELLPRFLANRPGAAKKFQRTSDYAAIVCWFTAPRGWPSEPSWSHLKILDQHGRVAGWESIRWDRKRGVEVANVAINGIPRERTFRVFLTDDQGNDLGQFTIRNPEL
jgi:hypothetical protein